MEDFSPHEFALMEKMTPAHKTLMTALSAQERKSMAENVKLENIDLIQSWIGTDEEIENLLFWDRGGKFDDPEWKRLKPLDGTSAALFENAKEHFAQLKKKAVESQRRSDLTLFSQFNDGLLFTGLAGGVRCDSAGRRDDRGEYFRGMEWRCIGSVEEDINSITVYPVSSTGYEVHFGSRLNGEGAGILVNTADSYSLLQLVQLSEKVLPQQGFATKVTNEKGETLTLEARAIRRAAGEGERLSYGNELRLLASARVEGVKKAFEMADQLSFRFYERYGLETEGYKIGRKYGNFFIMRDDNFNQFLPETPVKDEGLILITATLACRRCRREIKEFRDFAKANPKMKAVLVNLASPQSKFYERVFGDMGGGDANAFRKTAAGVTPFIIVYSADEHRILKYREYISTGKAENTPSLLKSIPRLRRYFD
jgi:thymidylate kinase